MLLLLHFYRSTFFFLALSCHRDEDFSALCFLFTCGPLRLYPSKSLNDNRSVQPQSHSRRFCFSENVYACVFFPLFPVLTFIFFSLLLLLLVVPTTDKWISHETGLQHTLYLLEVCWAAVKARKSTLAAKSWQRTDCILTYGATHTNIMLSCNPIRSETKPYRTEQSPCQCQCVCVLSTIFYAFTHILCRRRYKFLHYFGIFTLWELLFAFILCPCLNISAFIHMWMLSLSLMYLF